MHLPSDFEVIELAPGKQVEINTSKLNWQGQIKPTKLFILPSGALDGTPSYIWQLEDRAHGVYLAQITDTMLREGLNRAAMIRKQKEPLTPLVMGLPEEVI